VGGQTGRQAAGRFGLFPCDDNFYSIINTTGRDMNRYRLKSVVLSWLIFTCSAGLSQQFEWKAMFDGFLDNREYFNPYQMPQTIFGSRIAGEIGGSFNGIHRLRAGLDYMYEYGGEIDAVPPIIIMYYQYDRKPFTYYMGVFPRRDLLDYPLALLNDTLNYYRPYMQGIYLKAEKPWGYENVFIDWTSRQTDTHFERFLFGFSGRIDINRLFVSHHFLMGHFAGPGIPVPWHHLRDNGGFDINLGIDLSGATIFDTLSFSVGGLVSLDRTRSVDKGWQTPAGFLGQAQAIYRFAGIRTTLYLGEGHTFLYGDSFYKAGSYARIDLFVIPFHSPRITGKINWAIHLVEGPKGYWTIDNSQQVLVTILLDGDKGR